MGSNYLAQYLLNEGVLSQTRLEELLPKTRDRDLSGCLLDAGIVDSAELDVLSDRYRQCGLHPVRHAVRRLHGERTELEESYYEEFMELFMDELMDFLKVPAVVSLEPVEISAFSKMEKTHAASQRLSGDLSIVTGIIGRDSYFLELAKRYAQEEMDDIDDLAQWGLYGAACQTRYGNRSGNSALGQECRASWQPTAYHADLCGFRELLCSACNR